MAIPLTINGVTFNYPVNFDENWGIDATNWASAVTSGMLQMAGGSFPLTSPANFGPNFGLVSLYYQSRSSNPATAGSVRLSSADPGIAFRNNANSGNLIVTTDASDNLLFNGQIVALSGGGGGGNPSFTSVTVSTGVILKDSGVKTVTLSAPTTLTNTWTLKFPISSGGNGQVLSTDGFGNTSWINPAGGGTVNSGTGGNLGYYATSSSAISDSGIVAANVALLTGNQTVGGVKTFSDAVVTPSTSFNASGGTITPNAVISTTVFITVDATCNINGPTGGYNGQKILFRLAQDSSGHAVVFATGAGNFSFSTDIPSFTASTANLTDYVGAVYNSSSNRWNIIGVTRGF